MNRLGKRPKDLVALGFDQNHLFADSITTIKWLAFYWLSGRWETFRHFRQRSDDWLDVHFWS